MRNPKLVPYETIVRATSGEPEAIDEVLRHYSKRIRLASLENGQVNKDTEDKRKLPVKRGKCDMQSTEKDRAGQRQAHLHKDRFRRGLQVCFRGMTTE